MQFFPISQGLERIGAFADKLKGDGWAQGMRRFGRKGTPYYIGKWWGVGQVFACVANLMVRMGW